MSRGFAEGRAGLDLALLKMGKDGSSEGDTTVLCEGQALPDCWRLMAVA